MPLFDEIFRARFPEDTLIIGPRGALGPFRDNATRGGDWVRLRLDRLRTDPEALSRLRRAARRWHVVSDFESPADPAIIEQVARATRSGRLVAIRAPRSGAVAAPVLKLGKAADWAKGAGRVASSRPASPTVPGRGQPAGTPQVTGQPLTRLDARAMSVEDRLVAILHKAVASPRLSVEAAAQLKAMLAPEQIAVTVGVLAAWVASQFLGIGLAFDILMLGIGIFTLGTGVIDAARRLMRFLDVVVNAKTEADLDEAADLLASVIVAITIDVLRAAIRRGVGRLGGPTREEGPGAAKPKPTVASSSRELDATPVPRGGAGTAAAGGSNPAPAASSGSGAVGGAGAGGRSGQPVASSGGRSGAGGPGPAGGSGSGSGSGSGTGGKPPAGGGGSGGGSSGDGPGKRRANRIPDTGTPNSVAWNPPGTTAKKYGPNGVVEKEFNRGHSGSGTPEIERSDHVHDHAENPRNPSGRTERGKGRPLTDGDRQDFGLE